MDKSKAMGPLEWAMLVALSVLWGGSFFFNRIAVRELPPVSFVCLRVGLGALILLVIVRARGLRMPREPALWAAFLGMGILNNVIPFSLIVWSEKQISSGLASILSATTPLFAVVMAHFLTADEKITPNKLIGVGVGFTGVAVLMGPNVLIEGGANLWAELAVLGAAVSYSCAGIFGRRFKAMGVPPLITATGQVSASALALVPMAMVVDRPWMLPPPSLETWLAVGGIAGLSTALAFILFFRILSNAGATNLMLVSFLIPASAILLGAVILNEQLQAKHWAGMAIIGVGLAAIDGQLFNSIRRRLGLQKGTMQNRDRRGDRSALVDFVISRTAARLGLDVRVKAPQLGGNTVSLKKTRRDQ